MIFENIRLATIESISGSTLWCVFTANKNSVRSVGQYVIWSNNYGFKNYVQKHESKDAAKAYISNVNKSNFDKLFNDTVSELKQDL